MKLLIDTNIFIPLEPTRPDDVTAITGLAAKLASLASQTNSQLWLHPAQRVDIAQDQDSFRRRARELLFEKYPVLNLSVGPIPSESTNDWVDDLLIEGLHQHAVSALVTEDRRLTKKAIAKVGSERVLSLIDAITSLQVLLHRPILPPPNVESIPAYQLRLEDPIWESFREQYPDFNSWLTKCQTEHRQAWIIRSPDSVDLAAVAIVNHETKEPKGSKTLKICSFKVDPKLGGRRYGELLLKAVFDYAFENRFDTLFVTVFPSHQVLIALLKSFGFAEQPSDPETEELHFVKSLDSVSTSEAEPDALTYFVERGPYVVDLLGPNAFVVPILPEFHSILFPEIFEEPSLFPQDGPPGNSLRKAYVCSAITNQMKAGDVLFFYRSRDLGSITAWGVVEEVLRSQDVDEICGFVLPRTVYTRDQISDRCNQGKVLAIMFRQVMRRIEPPISLTVLAEHRVLNGPPQSITKLSREAKEWIRTRCLFPF